jgi:diguanylate cyclase (GGDEF)-like protein
MATDDSTTDSEDVVAARHHLVSAYRHDPLTGAYDREAFDLRLAEEIEYARAYAVPLSIGMFDVDYFKSVNDAYGHLRGDEVLYELAQRSLAHIRNSDLFFRYGGDEFVLILPATSLQQATALAQRLVDAIRQTPIGGTPPLTISISLGIASFPNDGTNGRELFEVADRRNYLAKRRGRSQVVADDHETIADLPFEVGERLIERDEALDFMRRWLDRVTIVVSATLRIEGVPGSGRTRLLQELGVAASQHDLLVLRFVGTRQTQIQPFGALLAAEWPVAIPVSGDLAAVFSAIQAGIEVAHPRPLLICVDDPELLDQSSLNLIVQVLEHPRSTHSAVAYTAHAGTTIPAWLHRSAETLKLRPISWEGLRIWLRQALHFEPPTSLHAWFAHTTGGAPGRFAEAMKLLIDQQVLVRSQGTWKLQSETMPQTPVTLLPRLQQRVVQGLPPLMTDFIGRASETHHIIQRLSRSRLLTLLGPGGIGKTRLAAHVASLVVDDFADGVYFVDLAALTDPNLVLTAIGGAIGVRDTGNAPMLDRINAALANKLILLLLDNIEQVIDAAVVLPDLLGAAPGLKILVTSREILNIYGEHVYRVPPLNYPNSQQHFNLVDLLTSAAIALFVVRAQAVDDTFALTAANARSVVELCSWLEGLPLAIELAAARIHSFSPQELLSEFESRLALLSNGPRDRSSRQRTLRGAIEWSYRLLSGEQQRIFRHLSVYMGGCDAEAVASVAAGAHAFANEQQSTAMTPTLNALVDKSLARRIDLDLGSEQHMKQSAVRYGMLETIREFGLERLSAEHEEQDIRQAHLRYFTLFAEQADPQLISANQRDWIIRLEREHDNIRLALRWAIDQRDARSSGRLSAALARFWWMRSYLNEGRQWLTEALALIDTQPAAFQDDQGLRIHALVLLGLGTIIWRHGEHSIARAFLEQSVAIVRRLDDLALLGYAFNQAGLAYRGEHNYVLAEAYFAESLAIRQQLQQRRGEAIAMGNLGMAIFHQGRAAAARPYVEQSLVILRELQDSWSIAMTLSDLGEIMLAQREYELAQQAIEEMLLMCRELGDNALIAWALAYLGEISMHHGEMADALRMLRESLSLSIEVGDKDVLSETLVSLAHYAMLCNQFICAAQMLGMESVVRQQIGVVRSFWQAQRYAKVLDLLRAAMPTAELDAAWAVGRVQPVGQTSCAFREL